MATEQDKTLEALQAATRMEVESEEFYRQASAASSNELGKKLLISLADEEGLHRQRFQAIYDSLRRKKSWPQSSEITAQGKKPPAVLRTLAGKTGKELKSTLPEMEVVVRALALESKTYDFYREHAKLAGYPAEKELYDASAAEERGHHLALLDYFEYLKDPAGWFVRKEHPSLD